MKFVPAEYQVECGARLNAPKVNNPKYDDGHVTMLHAQDGKEDRGNSKSYSLKRLARDAERSMHKLNIKVTDRTSTHKKSPWMVVRGFSWI